MMMESYLSAEDKARVEIDKMLEAAGWAIQDARDVNLAAAHGVAVREFILEPPHGRADYLLFVDRKAVGVIEAKPEGATLTGVEWQSAKYLNGLPDWVTSALAGAMPFAYQSTGVETRFTNTLDPEARSREVFWFHRPETLAALIREVQEGPLAPTLRHQLTKLPELDETGLWPAQTIAIRNLEHSLAVFAGRQDRLAGGQYAVRMMARG
jgi:type I restriction enzyme, R subunit